jgi:hypothetical protein
MTLSSEVAVKGFLIGAGSFLGFVVAVAVTWALASALGIIGNPRQREGSVMDDHAAAALLLYFEERRDADDAPMMAYWAGRIDGHCLENAIDFGGLASLAARHGFCVDWPSALKVGYRHSTDLRTHR